ncbi:hypothetical protein WMY93_015840 [Mugilogobius chulae]|uniref:G-protein coupled receptors family 1 profile domain-containing protein n=1 Tax=Mugilogobius chulae TaxID=88201 RepID=A0AAW0NXN6_9GOBI
MTAFTKLLSIRIFLSCIGCIGNIILIFFITHSHVKMSSIKSFEVFLLGLCVSNLEQILIVNIYDIIILEDSTAHPGNWSCRLLKFLTISGELSSILFTVVICIYRYEKVRDATERVNLPTHLDNTISAIFISGFCFVLAFSLSAPIFVVNAHTHSENKTKAYCPPDFFNCNELHCPKENYAYKYSFVVICNILPLFIVTLTSCLIISALFHQWKKVEPNAHERGTRHLGTLSRSTLAVLAVMGLFQVDWSLYLFLQLNFQASNVEFWNEMKFFASTSYTSISPYVFGIGNHLFSIRHLAESKCLCF